MRETGSNISPDKKILSIRLTSSGLSFYVSTARSARGEERYFSFAGRDAGPGMAVRNIIDSTPELSGYFTSVNVFIDTADTVYAPSEVLRTDNAAAFLNGLGLYIPPEGGVAVSPAVGDVRAAMRYDARALSFLSDYYGAKLSFYSPLQENLELAGRAGNPEGFIANITERNIYIVRFDKEKRLLLSEVYPYYTDADIVFYLHKLGEDSGLRNPKIRIFGPGSGAAYKILRKYFRGVLCV